MSNWKPGDPPTNIEQYGYHHGIWTDWDLAKFALITFIAGVVVGVIF